MVRFHLISFQKERMYDQEKLGLVDSLDDLNGTTFSAERVSPVIRRFYENPAAFTLKAAVCFHWWVIARLFFYFSQFLRK
nr:hypothetical protein P5627_13400 [Bacillus safensis]